MVIFAMLTTGTRLCVLTDCYIKSNSIHYFFSPHSC